jgi:hypothetical protein
MAKTIEATEPLHLYGADWREEDAIKAGFFFVDVFGVKRGTRPPTPDPAILANPIQQDEIAAMAAVALANERRDAAINALQEAMRTPDGEYVIDMNTGKGFFMFKGKPVKPTTPLTIRDFEENFKWAEEELQRENLKLSRIQARRAERIRQFNIDQIPAPTALQKAISEAQYNGLELREADVKRLRG